jgi:hypothetical protein
MPEKRVSVKRVVFYLTIAIVLLYRGYSLLKSDMFSVNVLLNSFNWGNLVKDVEVMKISRRPETPLKPPITHNVTYKVEL